MTVSEQLYRYKKTLETDGGIEPVETVTHIRFRGFSNGRMINDCKYLLVPVDLDELIKSELGWDVASKTLRKEVSFRIETVEDRISANINYEVTPQNSGRFKP